MSFAKLFVKTILGVNLLLLLAIAGYVAFIYVSESPIKQDAFGPGSKINLEGLTFTRIETQRIGLNAITVGSTSKPLVILLHGFPETALLSWHHQLQHFRTLDKYFVVAPDMRGYNKSDKPENVFDYRLNELARDVVDIIDYYGKSYATVVGHDWGAGVAWWTAIMHPERVEKLAILNVPHPSAMVKQLKESRGQLKKSWYIFFFQLPFIAEMKFVKDDYEFPISALATAKADTFGRDDLALYKQAWSEPNAITSSINYYRASFRGRVLGEQEAKIVQSILDSHLKVQPPTYVIWGTKDAFLEPAMAKVSVDVFCRNGTVSFLEASHWVQHEKPKTVNKALTEFLEKDYSS